MSIQIQRLMDKEPQIFYDVSYEGNNRDRGDGTWLYMRPSWYCSRSDCGSIHEYTIAEVLDCVKCIYQDKQRWIDEHPEEPKEVAKILNGDYDRK